MSDAHSTDPSWNLVRFEISAPDRAPKILEHHVQTRTEDGVIRAWRVVSSREYIDVQQVSYVYSDWSLTQAERDFVRARFSDPELEHWFDRPEREEDWSRAFMYAKRDLERDVARHTQARERAAFWGESNRQAFAGGIKFGALVFLLVGGSVVFCCSGKFITLPESTQLIVDRANEGNVAGFNFTHTAWQRDECMSECRETIHPSACVDMCDCVMGSYKELGAPVVTEENHPDIWAEVATACAHIADPLVAQAFFDRCQADCVAEAGVMASKQCDEVCACGRERLLRSEALLLLSGEEVEERIEPCL